MSLLFEDLFKRLNADIKRQADSVLSKTNRATQVVTHIRARAHTRTGDSEGGGEIKEQTHRRAHARAPSFTSAPMCVCVCVHHAV